MSMYWVPVIAIVVLFIICVTVGYDMDKRFYNNGYCKCGGEWVYFDMDSGGGRGYKCPKCKEHIWISYPVDKGYKEVL